MLSYPTTWVPPQRSTVPPNQPECHVEFVPGTCWQFNAHFVQVPVMLSYLTTWVPPQRSTVPPNQPDSHVEFIQGTCQEISDILSGCCLWCYPIRQLGFHHSAALFLLTNQTLMWNLFRGLVKRLVTFCPGVCDVILSDNLGSTTAQHCSS